MACDHEKIIIGPECAPSCHECGAELEFTECGPGFVLYVGSAGDVSCMTANGDSVTIRNIAAGTVLPVRLKRVNCAGTTAGNMVAWRCE